jgi:hypothetical protein
MTSRRDVLKVGLAATALPIAARARFVSAEPVLPTVPLYKILYDTRFPASIAFARRAAARGLAVHASAGDMTRFWYDDLYYRWLEEPAAIAGLTAPGALFCLERLAWDQRMRVVYRGEHAAAADGCVSHRLEGPERLLAAAAEAATGPAWAAALADVVAGCPRGRAATRTVRVSTRPSVTAPSATLCSWVIAPVLRA